MAKARAHDEFGSASITGLAEAVVGGHLGPGDGRPPKLVLSLLHYFCHEIFLFNTCSFNTQTDHQQRRITKTAVTSRPKGEGGRSEGKNYAITLNFPPILHDF